jgi:hypothetical protein
MSREHPARRRQEQLVAAAKARPGHLPPEHRKLMAKDDYLHAVVQPIGWAGGKADHSAQQQVQDGEDHGSCLL